MSDISSPSILLIAPVQIDAQMLGPGLRYWEFARILSAGQRVTLLTPNDDALTSDRFAVRSIRAECWEQELAAHQVVVLQGLTLFNYPELSALLRSRRNHLAIDLYTPLNLEGLAIRADASPHAVRWNEVDVSLLREQLKLGDFFFCASERQRDYYLGMLACASRLNPHVYADDPTLRRLIDVVAFGLSSRPPEHHVNVLKGVHPKVGADDVVVLWFGGVWNWLDPLTVIRAFAEVAGSHARAKLVFVTKQHAGWDDPASATLRAAIALSKELGLYDERVLFCDPIPFDRRANLLLEADIGVCSHGNLAETRFAFRTRLLDYLWADLPILTTQGDALSELVEAENLGYATPAADVGAFKEKLLALLDEPDARAARRDAFARVKASFTWEQVTKPLVEFCRAPRHAADWNVTAYAAFQSTDWERLVFENAQTKHRISDLEQILGDKDAAIRDMDKVIRDMISTTRDMDTVIRHMDAAIHIKDDYIRDREALIQKLLNGRVMRLMTSVQTRWAGLPFQKRTHPREE